MNKTQRGLDRLQVEYRETKHDFVILCPWHNEKTPSLHIDKETEIWHCFGCGKRGKGLKSLFPDSWIDDDHIPQVSLGNAIQAEHYNKVVKVTASVVGKDLTPSAVISRVLFKCDTSGEFYPNSSQEELDALDPKLRVKYGTSERVVAAEKHAKTTQKKKQRQAEKCSICMIHDHNDEWSTAPVDYFKKPEVFLELYGSPSGIKEKTIIKRFFNSNCDLFNYSITSTQNIVKLLLQPDYSNSSEKNTNFVVEAYTFDTEISMSKTYTFTVCCTRNPQNSKVAFIIMEAEATKTNSGEITEDDVALLRDLYVQV